jgi:DNA gyrase subunit A
METVPFIDNYDANEHEPAYLTGYFPNLLANGTMGIAVGMATSIPPHNLNEVVSGIIAYINNNEITIDELLADHIKGPDFPTGALMTNGQSMVEGYKTGRGSVKIRAKIEIEQAQGHERLVISEIPYQVNKSKIVEKIAELVKTKVIQDIADIRDETSMKGIRIVIDLKRDANPDLVLSQLYKYTQLQTSFSINLLSLHNNIPVLLDLKSIIKYYVEFQVQMIVRRSVFEKNKLEKRLHILNALSLALDNIDEVIEIIRSSQVVEAVREKLTARFGFDEEQNKAILDMRLQRLVGLERDKILAEIGDIKLRVEYLTKVINDQDEQNKVLIEQLELIVQKFGDERRTHIIPESMLNIDDEELIPDDKMMILLSEQGYVRRVNPDEFRVQKRGGRGVNVNSNKEDQISLAVMGKMRD